MSFGSSVFMERISSIFPDGPPSTVWLLTSSMITTALIVFCYRYFDGNRKGKVVKKRIPGPKVHPVITTVIPLISIFRNKAASLASQLFQVCCGYTHVFRKEGMWLFWGGIRPILILSKPETVEPVLNSVDILEKGFEYDFVSGWLKEGLLTSKGNKWRMRRKLVTPAFYFRVLQEFFPVFNEQARVFITNIRNGMEDGDCVDIAPLTTLCTLDIICETAMGKKLHAQKNSSLPYVQALHTVTKLVPQRLMQPWLWTDFVYYLTKSGKTYKKCLNIMDNFTRTVVAERKQDMLKHLENKDPEEESTEADFFGLKNKRRLALLDLLLQEHLKDPSFSLEDIAEEVDTFMFAGHDTTSSGLGWGIYMLGLYPEIQRKAHEEVDAIFGDDLDRPVTPDDIKEMKYLDLVFKEARRLIPPTPFIARELRSDTEINGYTIPKGTNCGIMIYMLHRDPDTFPNPEVFDPERFTLENCSGRHPYAYVPFSAGPRNCIGQRFAIFEALTVTANVLRYYDVKAVDPMDQLKIVDELVMRSENGLRVVFTPRSKAIEDYVSTINAKNEMSVANESNN